MSTHTKCLAEELRTDSGCLNELTAEQSDLLVELVRNARVRQRAELAHGLETVLGALPRFVRGPARAIMFGGSS